METIEIKNIYGDVIFKHTAEDNTITLTVEAAVSCGVSLAKANLVGACLEGANLEGANLEGANLEDADLSWADLIGANLTGANLASAILICANLKDANLKDANLKNANLYRADLSWANLKDANLKNANIKDANLKGADLTGANLASAILIGANLDGSFVAGAKVHGAKLNGAKNIPFIPLSCPSEGAFIGWKKVEGKYLVKIQIPEDAKRLSATTRKCRCDKALVLDITSLDGNEHYDEVVNYNYTTTVYKVGEKVYPDSFDENRWNECSNGIHFFVNKEDAINY